MCNLFIQSPTSAESAASAEFNATISMCSIMFYPFSICVCMHFVCLNGAFTANVLFLTFFIIVFVFFSFLLTNLMQLTLITKERERKKQTKPKWKMWKLTQCELHTFASRKLRNIRLTFRKWPSSATLFICAKSLRSGFEK